MLQKKDETFLIEFTWEEPTQLLDENRDWLVRKKNNNWSWQQKKEATHVFFFNNQK